MDAESGDANRAWLSLRRQQCGACAAGLRRACEAPSGLPGGVHGAHTRCLPPRAQPQEGTRLIPSPLKRGPVQNTFRVVSPVDTHKATNTATLNVAPKHRLALWVRGRCCGDRWQHAPECLG